MLASGNACVIHPHNDGRGNLAISNIISYIMQEIVGQDETILNATAKRSRENIDPVVAQILPNFSTERFTEMRLNDINEPNAIAWVLGHTDHTYTPQSTFNRTPISYGTLAVSLNQDTKELYGHEHDGFYKLTPGTSINGFKSNRLEPDTGRLLFNIYWHRIAFFQTNSGLLAANPNPMTCFTPRIVNSSTGEWALRGQTRKRQIYGTPAGPATWMHVFFGRRLGDISEAETPLELTVWGGPKNAERQSADLSAIGTFYYLMQGDDQKADLFDKVTEEMTNAIKHLRYLLIYAGFDHEFNKLNG